MQGDDIQADYPDDMRMGEGSGPDSPDDSSFQNVPPGSVRSEGSLGVPRGFALDLGRCILSQLGKFPSSC